MGRRALPWLVGTVLLAGGGLGLTPAYAAEPAPATSADAPGTVKYYVVGHTGTAEREYLFEIAAQTLGDGRRYLEIFELNKGRPQPDGQRLEDPLVLMPGWILILPDDADGPGVLVGPPPVFGTAHEHPPTTGEAAPAGPSGDGLVRAAALIVVTVILAVSLHLLRRGRRIELPKLAPAAQSAGPSEPAPGLDERPPDRPAGPHDRPSAPASRTEPGPQRDALERTTTAQRAVGTGTAPRPAVGAEPTPRRTSGAETTAQRPVGVETAPRPTSGAEPTLRPTTGAEPTLRPTTGAEPTPRRSAVTEAGTRSAAAPRPAPAAAPATGQAEAATRLATRAELRVRAGTDQLTVRLVGARPDAGESFFGRGESGGRRPGAAIVRLGDPGPDAIWLDLTASPDVITVTGDRRKAQRHASALAAQLTRGGVSLAVVGDVPGITGAGLAVASLGDLTERLTTTPLLVAFLGELPSDALPTLHALLTRRQPRVIPIVVGSERRSRWSIDVA